MGDMAQGSKNTANIATAERTMLCQTPAVRILRLRYAETISFISKGGIFGDDDMQQELAFRYAVDRINMDKNILEGSKIVPIIERVSPKDCFQTAKRVCNMTEQGVAAIFGPSSRLTSSIVQSTCDNLEIPHLETRWDNKPHNRSCLLNLHPHPPSYSAALRDLLKTLQWRSFTIIYENNESLIRLQEILKAHGQTDYPVTVRQLGEGHDHR
ncbi:hypothetical protein J437_LFUL002084 [Ladona fulva]|uniref:Receptor ligand binding region domain-containing protein n=1 Tax=Ladona fulva TaxID=123851 RepID=A0A8K0K0X3_LADFU|nr:hypothetical protein J437_LFUL002084 [Ladona fulva]